MPQFRLTWLLLTPSLFSGIVVFGVTLLFLGLSIWGYVNESNMFYDYFFGASGLVTILLSEPDITGFFRSAILNNPTTYNVFIITAAVVVGVVIFEVLEVSKRVAKNSSTLWYRLPSPSAAVRAATQAGITRLGIRIAAIMAWMMYILLYIALALPFCITLLHVGITLVTANDMTGWLYGTLAAILFAFCTHLHIVFARLVLLRPRIFGGVDVEIAALT